MTDKNEISNFAAGINLRLANEIRVFRAKQFSWVCSGVAIATVLTGLGVALTFLGYSHTISVKPAAELTTQALVNALQQANLKTIVSGSMSLSSDSELKLVPNQSIALSGNTAVRLDPNTSVQVIGNVKVDVPQPSKEQLQLEANEATFTNYTIFKDVIYGKGKVETGWDYDLYATHPKSQYCKYRESIGKGLSAGYILAFNGIPKRPTTLKKLSFDFDGALANCIWFSE